MAKKRPAPADVLVLGSHPSTYLAAAMLAQAKVPVRHVVVNGQETPDRLAVINSRLFELHKTLAALRKKLDLTPVHGLRFLADEPGTSSEYAAKSPVAFIGSYEQLRAELRSVAQKEKVPLSEADHIEITQLDEAGVSVEFDGNEARSRLLIVGGPLPHSQRRILGMAPHWDAGVLHRYTYLVLRGKTWRSANGNAKPLINMSLDLLGQLFWAWLLPADDRIQLAVEQPVESIQQYPPAEVLRHWIGVLEKHGQLTGGEGIDVEQAIGLDLPLTGALAQEGVANRTLLMGPAGGFFTACAEDIFPGCWSALFAADVAKSALDQPHLQDALREYRGKWGSTLGDYLRGPQQNLRFLLPLVYRNPVMTARLAEAILAGKSVVR